MSAVSRLERCVSSKAPPACGFFTRHLAAKRQPAPEVGNSAKGQELTREENLETREITERELYHAAVPGDLRSTSGLGLGDGLFHHTEKWLQVGAIVQLES